jgi:transposase-like protein
MMTEECGMWSEDEARTAFQKLRWAESNGKPVCPFCGKMSARAFRSRYVFKCKSEGCKRQFSVTKDTIFEGSKFSFRTLMHALDLARNDEHLNAWRFSRKLRISYKAGYVLSRKIVEALNKDGLFTQPSKTWIGYWQRGLSRYATR